MVRVITRLKTKFLEYISDIPINIIIVTTFYRTFLWYKYKKIADKIKTKNKNGSTQFKIIIYNFTVISQKNNH